MGSKTVCVDIKWCLIIIASASAISFLFGRHSAPSETEIVEVEVEKIVEKEVVRYEQVEVVKEVKAKDKIVYREKAVAVDGSSVSREAEIERITEALQLDQTRRFFDAVDRSVKKETATSTKTEYTRDYVQVGITAYSDGAYGFGASVRALGPLHLTGTGILTNSGLVFGVGAAVSF